MQRSRRVVLMGVLVALVLAAPAHARKFSMSGTWFVRNGSVFIPLQFAGVGMDMTGNNIFASMGNLTGAYFFPNGPVPGQGLVSANGSAPATLMVPQHRFVEDVAAAIPLSGITLVQITTNFGVDGPYAAATLAAGGGPGSFTWCPGNPACVAGGGMRSTDPPNGGTRNGRVIYVAGANQFGGVMQLGLKRGGINTFLYNAAPQQFGHATFGGVGNTLRALAPGGPGSADFPATTKEYLKRGVVTQPTMTVPPFNLILYPGPKLTTMLGLSNTATGAIYYLPTLAIGPMGTLAGQFTSNSGFPHTTGTVIAQQTTGTDGQDFHTFMGSDGRTPLGGGNLSTVAGGLSYRNTLAGNSSYATLHKVSLTLAPPIPSLSPAGVAAASALMLLAVGLALRRRLR